MTTLPLYWIDAFTDRLFTGNPAAVVPLEHWIEDARLQRIAFENGVSETAFFVRTGERAYRLRWFTPYWAERLGRTRLHARQISARGGELWCESQGDRTRIAGRAVRYLRGEIGL